jgi:hypothetical protein
MAAETFSPSRLRVNGERLCHSLIVCRLHRELEQRSKLIPPLVLNIKLLQTGAGEVVSWRELEGVKVGLRSANTPSDDTTYLLRFLGALKVGKS